MDWNLIFYTFTDNELEVGSFKDLAKLTSIRHNYNNVTINILLDTNTMGSYRIKLSGNPYKCDAIRMTRLSHLNMSKMETLTSFLKESVSMVAAKHVVLILGGHGAGWYLLTEKASIMSMRCLANAISASGIHLNLLCFDVCLLANLESLYTLRHVTDFIIAYEDYAGWNGIIEPQTLEIFSRHRDPLTVAIGLAENLIATLTVNDDQTDVSVLSAVDVDSLVKFIKGCVLRKPTDGSACIDPNYWQLQDLFEVVKESLSGEEFKTFEELFKRVVLFYKQSKNKNNPKHHGLSCIVDPDKDIYDTSQAWKQLDLLLSFSQD